MTEHDHTIEHLYAERERNRDRIAELEFNRHAVANGIDALQDTLEIKPSYDFEGCIE